LDGIAEMDGLSVKLNPNPVSDIANIEFTASQHGNITMDIMDQTGRNIQRVFNGYVIEGSHLSNFDSSDLSSGFYFLNIKYRGQNIQIPFIVTK
jgi:hypothetical protein